LGIGESGFEFGMGGPLVQKETVHLNFEHFDFGSLSFFDTREACYKNAFWNEVINQWLMCKSQ